jgi:hypothetical protein
LLRGFRKDLVQRLIHPTHQLEAPGNRLGGVAHHVIGERKPHSVHPNQATAKLVEYPGIDDCVMSESDHPRALLTPNGHGDCAVGVHCNCDPLSEQVVEFPSRLTGFHRIVLRNPANAGAHSFVEILPRQPLGSTDQHPQPIPLDFQRYYLSQQFAHPGTRFPAFVPVKIVEFDFALVMGAAPPLDLGLDFVDPLAG